MMLQFDTHPMMHQLEFLKEFSEVFVNFIHQNFNTRYNSGSLPAMLKSNEVITIFKRKTKTATDLLAL